MQPSQGKHENGGTLVLGCFSLFVVNIGPGQQNDRQSLDEPTGSVRPQWAMVRNFDGDPFLGVAKT